MNTCGFCETQLGMDDFDNLCADESFCNYCEQIIPVDEREYSTEICRKCHNAGLEEDESVQEQLMMTGATQ